MKAKALRKKNTHEFVEFINYNTNLGEIPVIFTRELPVLQPITATMELMRIHYRNNPEINFDELELIELKISILSKKLNIN